MKQLKNPLIWLIASFSLASCGSILAPVKQRTVNNFTIFDEQINYHQPECESTVNNNVLYISKMTAYPPYDTNKMYYMSNPYELNSFGYSQWITPANDLITQEVAKKVAMSCTFKNMVGINSLADANYRLSSILIGVREEVSSDGSSAKAHLAIGSELVEMNNNRVAGSFLFDQTESMTSVSPVEYARAVSRLVSRYNNQLVPWLQQKAK